MVEIAVKCSGRASVKASGDTFIEAFEQAARAAEILCESTCGKCGGTDIRPHSRQASGNGNKQFTFFELLCNTCGYYLSLGETADGTGLYPRRKLLDNGQPSQDGVLDTETRGWTNYRGQDAAGPHGGSQAPANGNGQRGAPARPNGGYAGNGGNRQQAPPQQNRGNGGRQSAPPQQGNYRQYANRYDEEG